MKKFLQKYVVLLVTIYVTSLVFPGIAISNGFNGLLLTTAVLLVGFVFIRPVLHIITLPLALLTFGLFSVITTALVLFLVSFVYKGFAITPFMFPRFEFLSFTVNPFAVSLLLSYVIISATIQLLVSLADWLFDL